MKPNFSFKYNGEVCTADTDLTAVLDKGVSVALDKKEYPDFDAVEWVLWFENNSNENSGVFSDILDADTILPLDIPEPPRAGYRPQEGNVCVISMRGMVNGTYYWENDKTSATEYNLDFEYLAKRKTRRFANVNGRSSDGTMPFFDVTAQGGGYIVAIGWTGDWKAEFTKTEDGVSVKTGLKETGFYLKTGEKLRTTSALVMKYSDTEDKYNKFRDLIKKYFSHKTAGSKRDGLMAFELWGGLTSDEMVKRINELASHDIKFEDIWIDAGWYGECTKCDEAFTGDWSMHTGEWEVNKRVHPDEFIDVKNAAENAGMKLMLWFEPERAVKGTKILAEHPDWFLTCSDDPFAVLNYGNREALEYAFSTLEYYTEKLKLSCYRQDFNIALTKYFKAYDEENRRGITEIKHILGMYEVWDRLHEKFPDLIIDNCSSGGRRFDIETLKRSIAFFRSDYQCNFNPNAEVLQTHNANASLYLPYVGCTTKAVSDTYGIRSSYSPSWGGAFYNAVFQSMSEDDFKWAKKVTDEYRYLRKYLSKDFYNHGSSVFDTTAWAVWQYHDKDTNSGIIMAFRRSESPFDRVKVVPKGFADGKIYSFKNLDDGTAFDVTDCFEIVLPEKRSCVIYEYNIK